MLSASKIKVIFFDLFGTCVNAAIAIHDDVTFYGQQIEMWRETSQVMPQWWPLVLPQEWVNLPAFDDSAEGLRRLRAKFTVLTLSNFPLWLQIKMCKQAGIEFDGIVPLEVVRCYKPFDATYRAAATLSQFDPGQCLMVTANEHFGDLDASRSVGMQSILIDRKRKHADGPKTIIELAEMLGC